MSHLLFLILTMLLHICYIIVNKIGHNLFKSINLYAFFESLISVYSTWLYTNSLDVFVQSVDYRCLVVSWQNLHRYSISIFSKQCGNMKTATVRSKNLYDHNNSANDQCVYRITKADTTKTPVKVNTVWIVIGLLYVIHKQSINYLNTYIL